MDPTNVVCGLLGISLDPDWIARDVCYRLAFDWGDDYYHQIPGRRLRRKVLNVRFGMAEGAQNGGRFRARAPGV